MKIRNNIIVLLLITLFTHKATAQTYSILSDNLDSLIKETRLPHTEAEMAVLFMKISTSYLHINSDSCIHYAEKSLEYNKNNRDIRLRFNTIGTIVEGLMYQGNLPKALEIGLAGIEEKTELSLGNSNKGRIYNGVGEIYTYLEDYEKARYYFTEITKMTGLDIIGTAFGHHQLAKIYESQNRLDSALYHLNKSYEIVSIVNKSPNPYVYEAYPGWYNTRARVYLKQNKPKSAKADLFKTLAITKISGEDFHTSNTYYDLAFLFESQNEKDSSIYYAEKALFVAEGIHYIRGILNASKILSTLYEEIDSKKALGYYKINADAKNQLYSSGNIQTMKDIVAQNEKRAVELQNAKETYQNKLKQYFLYFGLAAMLFLAFILYRNNKRKEKANKLLQSQKEEIDFQKQTAESTLKELKSTQTQLIHAEKMASLGELTAGIAHEIQNPLNFVNNFSEVSTELVKEMVDEFDKGNTEDVKAIANDVVQNLEKINHHGKRAADIVKGMLQHSRTSTGQKEPTDINTLADEYLRLAYHGLRAKDKSFNADFKIDLDSLLPKVNVVPQDIGRVLLNLINNAFYVVDKKAKEGLNGYKPEVTVTTKLSPSGGGKREEMVEITVSDNGPGVPEEIKDKIFQPFFTTKPTGQGTGLGLSLSYDIVKAHGGELTVETIIGKGSKFIISFPLKG
jgi:two-component system, NtrC family, sensor kinase